MSRRFRYSNPGGGVCLAAEVGDAALGARGGNASGPIQQRDSVRRFGFDERGGLISRILLWDRDRIGSTEFVVEPKRCRRIFFYELTLR